MKPDYTHISIVLDRSGSMSAVAEDTIGGFNRFLETQKSVPGECTLTLVQFDDKYEELYIVKPVQDIPKLDNHTFVPRGYTALYDAVGRTIDSTGARLSALPENMRPSKVIFVILTDGHENASKEFSIGTVKNMISTQREKYSWEFVFLGANIDAIQVAQSMDILTCNAINYMHSGAGAAAVMDSMDLNVKQFRTGAVAGMSFTAEQRKEQDDLLNPTKA